MDFYPLMFKLDKDKNSKERMQKLTTTLKSGLRGETNLTDLHLLSKNKPNKWFPPLLHLLGSTFLSLPVPCCLPSGSRVASSSLVAVRGGRATLTVSRDSRTAASSQAHEAIPLVGVSAPHTPLLHLPLDTDPIWGGPPNHQLLPGWPVTQWNSPNHLGWEANDREREREGGREGGGRVMIEEVDKSVNRKAARKAKKKTMLVWNNESHFKELVSAPFSPVALFLTKWDRKVTREKATETQCFKMLSNKPCHRHTEAVRHQQSTHKQTASTSHL